MAFMFTTSTQAQDGITQTFAGCLGRTSAELEHAWLMGTPNADALQTQYTAFDDLLQASQPPEDARAILKYRIEVKMAHASLLTNASFEQDETRATRSRYLAARYMSACETLLLNG
ncbi:MAG: hypothetical protein AB8B62_12260 [Roseobacter sp.]